MSTLTYFVGLFICLATAYAAICPDGSICDDSSTCCPLASNDYACCPYPSATCCSDGKSCCPGDYTCDVEHGQCIPKSQLALIQLSKLKEQNLKPAAKIIKEGVCPGPECSEGCCPYPAGNCCEDGAHCCPPLTVCSSIFGLLLCIPGMQDLQ